MLTHRTSVSSLKRIDEFNYAVFTIGWAQVARTQLDRG